MFDFLRRLFNQGATSPSGAQAGTVATITVRGAGQARRQTMSGSAALVAADPTGSTLLRCYVVIQPNPGLIAQMDPSREPGDIAQGDYIVDAVLPARDDSTGIALFGPYPMLRLRALVGESRPPPVYGRTVLLIHGGPSGQPTDGSIRMDDADLVRLLELMPAEPGNVRVRLIREGDLDTDIEPSDSTYHGHDDPLSWMYYDQLYRWDRPHSDTTPYADLSSTPGLTGSDANAALALADLGYGVTPDAAAPDAVAPSFTTSGSAEAGAGASGSDPGWAPTDGGYAR